MIRQNESELEQRQNGDTFNTLTREEILGLAPPEYLRHVIAGVKKEHGFSVSFMLNVPQSDASKSKGTGFEFITDEKTFQEICRFARQNKNPNISCRCPESDRQAFMHIKEAAETKNTYEPYAYQCSSCNLLDFVVPIYEKESKSFIGAIFGCQKRPKENVVRAFSSFKKFISQPENKPLQPHFWALFWKYRKVKKAGADEMNKMIVTCQGLARELATLFRFYIDKKSELAEEANRKRSRESNVGEIHKGLLRAQTFHEFWEFMPQLAAFMWEWLPVDWCLVLQYRTEKKGRTTIEEIGRARQSRGIKPAARVNASFSAINSIQDARTLSASIATAAKEFVSEDAECETFDIKGKDDQIVAILVVGSSPHILDRNHNYDRIQSMSPDIQAVVNAVGMEYGELVARRNAEERANQLEGAKNKLADQVKLLEETLMSLNHQLHGPLFMLCGSLSLIREILPKSMKSEVLGEIEVGIEVAQLASFLCSGLARILAHEQGRRMGHGIGTKVIVSEELRPLASAMKRTRGHLDRNIEFFLDDSPPIRMDKVDFTFVFGTLFDNALKYADSDKSIRIECSYERTCSQYCFKVKSIGPPISDEDRSKVFEKFWRHPDAWQDDEMGLGIGCWAARECMRRSGGDLYLETNGDISVFIVKPPEETERRTK